MSENQTFQAWAIVEVMGHVTYAGYVTAETIAGKAMLRVDVPQVGPIPAFTKYISPDALYGLTPVAEETARAKAESTKATPFACWDVKQAVENNMRERGLLLEHNPLQEEGDDDDMPY